MILMLPPVVFLVLFGSMFHEQAGRIESREFYEKVNDPAIGQAIGDILAEDRGFYRLELVGNETENAAELNRVRTMGQYISSLYSSSYNREYQEFRKTIFEVEEPFRNDLMQAASDDPLYQKLMGVKYILGAPEDEAALAAAGYTPYKKRGTPCSLPKHKCGSHRIRHRSDRGRTRLWQAGIPLQPDGAYEICSNRRRADPGR